MLHTQLELQCPTVATEVLQLKLLKERKLKKAKCERFNYEMKFKNLYQNKYMCASFHNTTIYVRKQERRRVSNEIYYYYHYH